MQRDSTVEKDLDRRTFLTGSLGVLAAGALGSCSGGGSSKAIGPASAEVRAAERLRRRGGQRVVSLPIMARSGMVDLGSGPVQTWSYGDGIPGPQLRTTAGDLLRVEFTNQLPVDTSVHWHGVALRNDMDGVPGITQKPIRSGSSYLYEFTTPDPGTYFFHPHSGVQLDRGLYGVLIVDDRNEPGGYDHEWVVVLDDWIDGTGRTPDDVLSRLGSTGGMSHGGMMGASMRSPILGGAGDVDYPTYLINGRVPEAPATFRGKPGQRVRLRIISAASDTAFRVALGGHTMRVTHSDGFPVTPVTTDALLIGMGERFDVVIDLADGIFPLVAAAEGKRGFAAATVRTATGRAPAGDGRLSELRRRVVLGSDLAVAPEVRLDRRDVDRRLEAVVAGGMMRYRWTINGGRFPDTEPLVVEPGERTRLRLVNASMMFHPMHLHGHTFGLVRGGARKDTVIVRPHESIDVDIDADNPGQWALHCHNIYHAEMGMMTVLSYRN
jgi:FtsP/CotA-like multicopper oxidase with cupredoxin domain